MNKIWVTIFLILFLTTASAIEVESYDDELPNSVIDQSQLNENQIQLIQRLASLENKVDGKASKEDLTETTQWLYDELSWLVNNGINFIILAVAMMLLAVAVLMWGFYFILKAKRRIK